MHLSSPESSGRASAPELENILHERLSVLDHGFVRVIDYMGNDEAIVQAARVSYGKGTKHGSSDRHLIRYLMKNVHTTPFEMCEIKLHIKLPIFVARQWVRHRTANINEYSARYSVLGKEFYLPDKTQIAAQSVQNKQGRGHSLSEEESMRILDVLRTESERAYGTYSDLMGVTEGETEQYSDLTRGLSRELARMSLTLNYYTEWYWKIDLHNLLRFLKLRASPHAQFEIRAYAEVILDIVKKWVPHTYEAFVDYQMESYTLSKLALEVVKRMIRGERVEREATGLSEREWGELMSMLCFK